MKKHLVLLSLSTLVLGVGAASAQENGFAEKVAPGEGTAVQAPEPYGTASLTVALEASMNFEGRASAVGYNTGGGVDRFLLAAGGALQSSPHLPTGAQIERIELRACDSSASEEVSLAIGACPTGGSPCALAGSVSTGVAATPGCSDFSSTLASPLIINNQTAPILVSVQPGTSLSASFSAVKLYYRLRVSPAPATATFPLDVPTTHPFFRFVEAMAASGLTGGCAPSSFCPDTAVTRGQMAVFLSTALGLHFPN